MEYGGQRVSSIHKRFSNAVTRTGLEGVALHTLRHSPALAMVSSGIPIEKVAQYLGHSNVAVTYSTYGRFAPEHLSDAAEVLEFGNLRVVK